MRYIESYIHQNKIGVLIELETPDLMTLRCKEFKALAHDLAMQIAVTNPIGVSRDTMVNVVPLRPAGVDTHMSNEPLLDQEWIKEPGTDVAEMMNRVSQLLRTPIRITRFIRFAVDE